MEPEKIVFSLNIPHNELWRATGYEAKTTFWEDFTIADAYGEAAVRDTYRRAFDEWHGNAVYVTELSMVLNHKIWQHAPNNRALAIVYDELWKLCDGWCMDNLKGEDLTYYYETTD